MGTWNTAILGNDTACEVADYFKRMYLYQEGPDYKWSVEQIIDSLYTSYYDTIKDLPSEKCNLFFALALSLWKKGELTDQIKEIVRRLIYDKIDYEAWKDLEADEKTLKSRWQATTKFYEDLNTPHEKVSKRELQQRKVSLFISGTCLAVEHNGYFYGIVIANDGRNVDDGSNDLLFLDIKSRTLPSLEDFKNSRAILNDDLANFIKELAPGSDEIVMVAHTFNFNKAAMKKFQKLAVEVGRLELTRTFFESSSVRFNQLVTSHKSVELLLADVFNYWDKHKWKPSNYQLKCESKVHFKPSMLTDRHVEFDGKKFLLSDIYVTVYNGLWHVDVTIRINNVSNSDIEKCWSHFVTVFEHLTRREVNNFIIATEIMENMQPFREVNFSNYKMKHVKDSAVI